MNKQDLIPFESVIVNQQQTNHLIALLKQQLKHEWFSSLKQISKNHSTFRVNIRNMLSQIINNSHKTSFFLKDLQSKNKYIKIIVSGAYKFISQHHNTLRNPEAGGRQQRSNRQNQQLIQYAITNQLQYLLNIGQIQRQMMSLNTLSQKLQLFKAKYQQKKQFSNYLCCILNNINPPQHLQNIYGRVVKQYAHQKNTRRHEYSNNINQKQFNEKQLNIKNNDQQIKKLQNLLQKQQCKKQYYQKKFNQDKYNRFNNYSKDLRQSQIKIDRIKSQIHNLNKYKKQNYKQTQNNYEEIKKQVLKAILEQQQYKNVYQKKYQQYQKQFRQKQIRYKNIKLTQQQFDKMLFYQYNRFKESQHNYQKARLKRKQLQKQYQKQLMLKQEYQVNNSPRFQNKQYYNKQQSKPEYNNYQQHNTTQNTKKRRTTQIMQRQTGRQNNFNDIYSKQPRGKTIKTIEQIKNGQKII